MQFNSVKSLLFLNTVCCFFLVPIVHAQMPGEEIKIDSIAGKKKIIITAGGKPFTSFLFPDTLEKPVLYPVYAPDETIVTRGFPLQPREGEPTDHPHHVGLWLAYENVNGLDFWNNSYTIPADKKKLYGWIRTDSIEEMKSRIKGILKYHANWENIHNNVLLSEETQFTFIAMGNYYIIDRTTALTAKENVSFPDAKDGMLGLCVAHELELPYDETKKFTDNKENVTIVNADSVAAGNYLTSKGITGDSAWGTRGRWCMLYGKINNDTISIIIIDHPKNPGYPTYWHARGYGLFAANPLGEKIFNNGKEALNFELKKGETVTFRYRIVIASGKKRLPVSQITQLADEFAKTK